MYAGALCANRQDARGKFAKYHTQAFSQTRQRRHITYTVVACGKITAYHTQRI